MLSIWMVLSGSAQLSLLDGTYQRTFRQGETVLIPESAGHCQWEAQEGMATLLDVKVP
jgi:mannose-6-phosphate isomerase-like protein (cupin superfamily)